MSSSAEYVEHVCGQVAGAGSVRFRKMFGEYMIYVDDRPVLLVCDNTVFVKILPCLDGLMGNSVTGFPYEGAKRHYVLDMDNADLALEVTSRLLKVTPVPKPRARKGTKG